MSKEGPNKPGNVLSFEPKGVSPIRTEVIEIPMDELSERVLSILQEKEIPNPQQLLMMV